MSSREAATRRGPIDPQVLGLSGALRTHLLTSGVLAGVTALAILVQAEAIATLLPRLVAGEAEATLPLVGWLAAVAAVRAIAAGLTEASSTRALLATRATVRGRVLDRLANLRPDQRPNLGPAQVGSLTTTALDALEPWVRAYVPALVLAVVVPLAAGLRILGADLLSAVILAIVVPLIPMFMVLIGRATERQTATQWDALTRLAGRFLDVITGLATLRLFGRADAQIERVRVVTDRYRMATMRTLRIAFLSALVLEVLAALSVALIAVSLGIRLTQGSLPLETALLVLLLAPECVLPIRRVGAAFHAASAGTDAATQIAAVDNLPTMAVGTTPLPATGALILDAVSVVDPGRGDRLEATSLKVEPGELVALTGTSGAGKSTLLDVARGALRPTVGTVTLGRVVVQDLSLADRSAAIRWSPQHPHAIGSTVAASVALGHGDGPRVDEAVAAACDQVGVGSLLATSPEAISGGERRRVAIARSLVGVHLGTARFLLFDEPTAQLDAEAAAQVIVALRWAAAQGIGVLAATHDATLVGAATRGHNLSGTEARHAPRDQPEPLASRSPRPAPSSVAPDARTGLAPDNDHDPSARQALRWLIGTARSQRGRLTGAYALGILTEVCTVGLAATAAWLIVRAAEEPSFADLAVAAAGVRAFALGKGALRYSERLASHDATLRLLADLRSTVVGRLARLSPTGLPGGGRGQLLTRLIDDIDRLQDLFLRVLGPLVSTLVVAVGAAALIGLIDLPAGIVVLAAVTVAGVVLPVASYAGATTAGAALATARGNVAATTVEAAEHIEELVACSAEPAWRSRIEDQAAIADTADRRLSRVTTAIGAAGAALPAAACAGVVLVAGTAAPGSGLSGPALGVVVLLPLAVLELLVPLSAAGAVLARVQASAVRVLALLERPDPIIEPATPAPAPKTADLHLRDTAIGWPNQVTQVAAIDLALGEGEQVLVAGPSGSGKSTLAVTLVAFLAPQAGEYRIGGTPSQQLGGDGVRRLVTWCPQDPWFADTTLADNLRIARSDATDAELHAVLGVVHLTSWAERLPEGLDTRLERDATAMSGGERQRLALARALLGGHRAIVFDEPTAHLDRTTADAVLADLLDATADKAVVVLGHDTAAVTSPGWRAGNSVYSLEPLATGASRWQAEPASAPEQSTQG